MYLHVIKGSQQGAKIKINKNTTYRISSSLEDGDIYLMGDGDFAFSVKYNDIGVELFEIGNLDINAINGERVEENKLYFFDLDVIFQGIQLRFSDREHLNSDDIIEPLELDTGTEAVTNQSHVAKLSLGQKISQRLSLFLGHFIGYVIAQLSYWQKRLGKYFYFLLGVIGLFLILVIFIGIMLREEHKHERVIKFDRTKIEQKHEVSNVMLSLPDNIYGGLVVTNLNNGVLIKGILPNKASYDYLVSKLSLIKGIKIKYNIVLFPQMVSSILEICKQNNIMRASAQIIDSNGVGLALSGIANDMDSINNTQIEIGNKFGQFEEIDTSKIYLVGDLNNYWSSLSNDIKSQITFQNDFAKGIITISGATSKNNLLILQKYIDKFNLKYQPVVTAVSSVEDIVATMPFWIKEVYIGPNISWIVTNDGAILYEGGTYDGVTLLSINSQYLKFRSKFVFIIPMDELIERGKTTPIDKF